MRFVLTTIAAVLSLPVLAGDLPPRMGVPPNELLPGVSAEPVKLLSNKDLGYGTKQLKFDAAWEKSPKARGAGVKVAVLDTGADVNHVWLKANVKGTYNAITKTKTVTDGHGHGTHCCGTITECCPEVELFVVKVLDDTGSGSVVDIAHGIDYAVSVFQVDVISMSLGGSQADEYMPPAIARATAAGVLVVAAAGNEGPGPNTDGYPARYPGVVAVAANDADGKTAQFSSRGRSVYVIAPGVNIVSAAPGNKKVAMSGTSMACPHAAAGAAVWVSGSSLAKAQRPAAFAASLRSVCTHPATRSTEDGYGRPDVSAFVGATAPTPPPGPTLPAPTPRTVTISLADLSPAKQAELTAAGYAGWSWSGTTLVVAPPAPTPPAPTAPPVETAPAPVPAYSRQCPPGGCPAPAATWQPFGGRLRVFR